LYLRLQKPRRDRKKYFSKVRHKARSQKWIVDFGARDFVTGEGSGSQEYLVYFKITSRTDGAKEPVRGDQIFRECAQNKKGRGETSPRTQTPFAAAQRQRIA
jgi:hypothetical protein